MRLRLALALCVGLAACSSGGSNNTNTVPTLPWGSFRHDANNSGAGNGINQNKGTVKLLAANVGNTTISTPSIDDKGHVLLGTSSGAVSFNNKGELRWQLSTCAPDDGSPPVAIGSVSSSLTVQSGGTVVFGADASPDGPGAVFYLQEKNDQVSCKWAFTASGVPAGFGVRSSAQTQVDPLDLSLLSVFVGGDDGHLRALNGIGTPRWNFPIGASVGAPITSTPAVSGTGATYVTTPDGFVSGVDAAGNPLVGQNWPSFPIGIPPAASLLQSPAVNITIYAIGADSALFGINPDSTLKWKFQPLAKVLGSPAFIGQTVDVGSETILDTVVYLVDVNGLLYGVSDQNGEILQIQRCSGAMDRSCQTDSCGTGEGTCKNGKCVGSNEDCTIGSCGAGEGTCTDDKCVGSDQDCTPDSCRADGKGMCEALEPSGLLPMTSGSVRIESSPVVSGDLFAIVGTTDGRVCARGLDNTVPGDDSDSKNPWLGGCIDLGDGLPVLSSPAIGQDSRIYVTTATGVYVIE